jgi:hypothetical protein
MRRFEMLVVEEAVFGLGCEVDFQTFKQAGRPAGGRHAGADHGSE